MLSTAEVDGPSVALPWPFLLFALDLIVTLVRRLQTSTSLPTGISIGPGFALPHPEGVLISDKYRIGTNVKVFQQVMVAVWHRAAPTIEDDCWLFAGSKAAGGMTLRRGTRLGMNALVVENTPPAAPVMPTGVAVVPAPHRISGSRGSTPEP